MTEQLQPKYGGNTLFLSDMTLVMIENASKSQVFFESTIFPRIENKLMLTWLYRGKLLEPLKGFLNSGQKQCFKNQLYQKVKLDNRKKKKKNK